jgi:dTDP-glucose 4,6-dehydratase/UDP-glucuronate decarboxylase
MNNLFYKIIYQELDSIYNEKKFDFLKNKKILITGASGLLGHYFVAFFLKCTESKFKPKKITLLYKEHLPNYFNFLKKNIFFKLHKIDLYKEKLRITDKPDFVIHLATYAQPKKFLNNSLETVFLNTTILEKLLRNISLNGSFLYLSSSEVYSGLKGKPKENKIGTTNTEHQRASYIQSKLLGETIVNTYRKKYKLDAKSARLCLAFGPGNRLNDDRVLYSFMQKALLNKKIKMLDAGNDKRCYIYILDALQMLLNIIFFGKKAIYNVGGKKIITIKNLGKKISKIIHVPLIAKKKVNNNNNNAPKFASVDISLYEKDFGKMKFENFEQSLIKTINWQKGLYDK